VGSRRLLIFIVAYNADRTLEEVLDRIPESVWAHGTRVLIIDDASQDRTFEVGLEYERRHPGRDIEVLFNPVNQGYGGNQKLGYQYAIDHGFDAVALLHGDGQYAPEKLAELAQPVLDGEADAVMGTRMVSPAARRHAALQLPATGSRRGCRTGCSASDVRVHLATGFLGRGLRHPFSSTRRLPLRYRDLIQLLGAVGSSDPIPVYYGDEICHVNGIAYAWNVIRTTVSSRVHDLGILYQRKYDLRSPAEIYGLKLGYRSSHSMAIDRVPAGERVLDLGCGRGLLAAELAKKGCIVHGVDNLERRAAPSASPHDLDQGPRVDLRLRRRAAARHPRAPALAGGLLAALRACRGRPAPILISVPNIAFLPLRLRLLGGFEYGREGILDLTTAACSRSARSSGCSTRAGSGWRRCWSAGAFPKASETALAGRWWRSTRSRSPSRWGFSDTSRFHRDALPTVRALLERSRDPTAHRRGDRPPADPSDAATGAASPAPPALRKPAS
jgi:glycosyltransferase involved in cell wall biosynthesis